MSVNRIIDSEEPLIKGMVKVQPITARYELSDEQEREIRSTPLPESYGPFAEIVFMRTYSRNINGKKETFKDTVIRCVKGILSIRKNYYINHGIYWDEEYWGNFAVNMGKTMVKMQFLPPGRGLYICGTEFSYKRGASAFNNCAFVSTENNLLHAAAWMMDSLMCGCGIGFDTKFIDNDTICLPGCSRCRFGNKDSCECNITEYVVHDSREGWVKSLYLLIESYLEKNSNTIHFDYSHIRAKGELLKGFGGISSGSEPLRILHQRVRNYFECYVECRDAQCSEDCNIMVYDSIIKMCNNEDYVIGDTIRKLNEMKQEYITTRDEKLIKTYGTTRLVVDIFNAIGCCVVAGNIRRSSEIALGKCGDKEFLELKDFALNPERSTIGWMSNNTVVMSNSEDFKEIPKISERIRVNGEPGILNGINIQKFGRIGKKHPIGREAEIDKAIGLNPCGEINLESYEFCNLAEEFLPKCKTYEEAVNAIKIATFYASTVSLLPTHWSRSNEVIARNRRIGVSLSGIADFHDMYGFTEITNRLKSLYKVVRAENKRLAIEAGIPESIRVTTVKPSGTISLVAGVSSGIHFPTFQYAIRTIRIAANSDLVPKLIEAGIPHEPDFYSGPGTLVFSFPIYQGETRSAQHVSLWEQAMLQITLQREFADNSVSVTLYYDPATESDILENVIAQTIPITKSLSCLPHTEEGVYVQSPYQKIDKEKYEELISKIKPIQWDDLNEDSAIPRGCDGDKCMLF